MAKARRTPFGAAERFLGFPRSGAPGSAAVAPAPDDDLPDLAEAEVWYWGSAEGPGCRPASLQGEAEAETEGTTTDGRAPRRGVGGLTRAFADGRQVAASAPVEIPAWPSRFAAAKPALPFEMDTEEADAGGGAGWVPPHVYLARRQARASVVEGVGRTLKGRDLSRVRDAVWSRTGFDG